MRTFHTVRTFGIIYALISVLTLLWGLYSYQRRVTLIKSKWPGSFGAFTTPDRQTTSSARRLCAPRPSSRFSPTLSSQVREVSHHAVKQHY